MHRGGDQVQVGVMNCGLVRIRELFADHGPQANFGAASDLTAAHVPEADRWINWGLLRECRSFGSV